MDGRSAGRPGRMFGVFEHGLTLTHGRTNVLPFTIWMPVLDLANRVRIQSPTRGEVVVTTPRIPGLELHLPPGTIIRDGEGDVVREISITPIPVDRPPFPLPPGVDVPVYFTIQPGGSYVYTGGGWPAPGIPRGAWLVYPNIRNTPAGGRVPFWSYDPETKGWHVYGYGVVSADGRRVVPDPDVVLYEFTGAMIATLGRAAPPEKPQDGVPDGDPVDLATGYFVLQKTDVYLPDVIPIALTRVYRTEDNAVRAFGIGATHPYDLFFANQVGGWESVDLIMPDGARIHYVKISGSGFSTVLEHTATPSAFYGSRLFWNGTAWDVRLKNGFVYEFPLEGPLRAVRDRFGNKLTITRIGDKFGNISRITAPHGRYVDFTYDTSDRVTQAKDHTGRTVTYTYDAAGRLWKVTDSKGGVTEYTYDAGHHLLTIKDPRGIVYLTNEYDIAGRVIRQTQADAGEFEFAYTEDGFGRITRTDVTNPRGALRRVDFNAAGYATSDTRALGLPEEQATAYVRRNDQLVESIADPLGRVTRFEYDTRGNITSLTRLFGTADAVTSTFTYEPTHSLVGTATDPLGHTTTFTYDSVGRLLSTVDPLNQAVSVGWNDAGQATSVTDALGQASEFEYHLGDLAAVTTPSGGRETRFHDSAGRVVQVARLPVRS